MYVKGPQGEECNLLNVKLSDRKTVLKRIIKNKRHQIEFVEGLQSKNPDIIYKEFDKAIHRNEEGVIIKKLDSIYEPNERAVTWIKLKGDYLEGLTDTLDLLIVGGYFGEGRVRIGTGDWTEHITHFLVALMKKCDLMTPTDSILVPFTKVGTGYSVAELTELRNKLKENWQKQRPSFILPEWVPASNDKPDVYIKDPSKSIVLELKGAEIIRSNTFVPDYTLRFPRVVKIRYDKDWNDSMKLEELFTMVDEVKYTKNLRRKRKAPGGGDSPGKEGGHYREGGIIDEDDLEMGHTRKRAQVIKGKQMKVMSQYQDTEVSRLPIISNLFEGFEFYVLNCSEVTKSFMEEQIHQYGGEKVQNYLQSTTHFIAS